MTPSRNILPRELFKPSFAARFAVQVLHSLRIYVEMLLFFHSPVFSSAFLRLIFRDSSVILQRSSGPFGDFFGTFSDFAKGRQDLSVIFSGLSVILQKPSGPFGDFFGTLQGFYKGRQDLSVIFLRFSGLFSDFSVILSMNKR